MWKSEDLFLRISSVGLIKITTRQLNRLEDYVQRIISDVFGAKIVSKLKFNTVLVQANTGEIELDWRVKSKSLGTN